MENKIKAAIKAVKSAQIAKSMLVEMKKEKKFQKLKLKELAEEIETIDDSINLLSNFTVIHIFKHLIGKRKVELDIKKEHYLNLSLQYNEIKKSIEIIDYEISILNVKAENLVPKREELKTLLIIAEATITDGNLSLYRKIAKELRLKIELVNEIDEAINQGVALNKSLNKTLRYLNTLTDLMQDYKNDPDTYNDYQIDKLDKFENYITQLQHEFLKFRKEYNDVHKKFFGNSKHSDYLVKNFLKEIRRNLLTDVRGNEGLQNSIQIVSNLKSNVMSLTRSLRSDARKIEKEIVTLEKEEEDLLKNIN